MAKQGMKVEILRGMEDILPPESKLWRKIIEAASAVFSAYGYEEIVTPILEPLGLFKRSVGETTDIVTKEMYDFIDKSGNAVALRPEATASVVRAYINASVHASESISRYWYFGPMFRYERPQKGRQRQFYQLGAELLGPSHPSSDAEVMAMLTHFFRRLQLSRVTLEINSIGSESSRKKYIEKLLTYLEPHRRKLDEDSQKRLHRNPLRIFDSKIEGTQKILEHAPRLSEFLSAEDRDHFAAVQKYLTLLKIPYVVNERIVRGLDYYTRTAFEFTTDQLGAQNAVAAGGRYDGLVRDLGGPDIAAVGFAIGIERLVLLLQTLKQDTVQKDRKVYVAAMSEHAIEIIFPSIERLRQQGLTVEWDYEPKSLKSLMKRADKSGAEHVVIVGDDEIAKGSVIVRNLVTKEQKEVTFKDLEKTFA